MKILVTSCPNQGHFYPMIPLLWALRSAGHHVVVALPDSMAGVAARAGLSSVSLGADVSLSELAPDHATRPAQRAGAESLADHVASYYVPLAHRVIDAVDAVTRRFRPDLLLHTSWEYAGPVVAARHGIPRIKHGWGLTLPPEVDAESDRRLAPLYGAWGRPNPPQWWVDVCPPSLQTGTPECPSLPMTWLPFNGSAVLLEWLLDESARPRVAVTLGNVPISGDHDSVLSRTLTALSDVDVEVVVAAGSGLHCADVPSNVRVVPGVPLHDLMRTSSVAITHGGAGSVFAALANGLPQLVLPQMCVHFEHGDRIAQAGAGICLHPGESGAENVREAVLGLLNTPHARRKAEELRGENAGLLSPSEVVAQLQGVLA
ncbi:nucleotide disphospho-sugar-binding domain-containing protein [Lentzea sp. NBRC 102530]|uniref:nucleotide disphospho-sugar-binding domain-containing protein n=1 Tax=Lentzea sp. NBRC 102530 TaxID=3032201 RepID=UPI0024A2EE95|nr:nucleotide disphospho-sugar-binding domain-containing protein [Lentzea sp. NBRC 102530]GLY54051.1 glycosyl transferase [Lentzea sp. NBRC 102530]